MLEFALVLPLVLVVLLAAVEVLVVARTQLEVVHAARVGAREAAATPDPDAAVAAVRAALGADNAARARVGVRRPSAVGRPAVVTVELGHRFAVPLFGGLELRLSARAVMRVER